jgi:hypothetical protein
MRKVYIVAPFDYICEHLGCKMEENQKKNVTLYLNSILYDKYVKFCKREGFALSRQIEKFIEGELNNETELN